MFSRPRKRHYSEWEPSPREPPGIFHRTYPRQGSSHRLPSRKHPAITYNRRQGYIPPGNRNCTRRPLDVSFWGYYRVKFQPWKNCERNELFAYISEKLGGKTLLPFRLTSSYENLTFFVNDYQIAKDLANQDEQIYLPNGTIMRISVNPANPTFFMDDDMTKAITSALNSNYNPERKAADLSNFQNNQIFIMKELICSLNLFSVLIHVTDVLMSLAPDLAELNLNNNSLIYLEEAGSALSRFRCLKVMHLAGNRVRRIKELAHLSALNLEELDLRGNDLPDSFGSRNDYVREVLTVFPSLRVLDGEVLPTPVRFDLTEREMGLLPKWLPWYTPGNSAEFAKAFLSEFYSMYDEIGRCRLAALYHGEAVMSMICYVPVTEGGSYSTISAYHPLNRNFMLSGVREPDTAYSLLFRGPEQIVGSCRKLPASLHKFETFVCDVVIFESNFVQIAVTGLFEELGNKPNVSGEPFKGFHRCFVLVGMDSRFSIIQDSIVIRYPTTAQIQALKEAKNATTGTGATIKSDEAVKTSQ